MLATPQPITERARRRDMPASGSCAGGGRPDPAAASAPAQRDWQTSGHHIQPAQSLGSDDAILPFVPHNVVQRANDLTIIRCRIVPHRPIPQTEYVSSVPPCFWTTAVVLARACVVEMDGFQAEASALHRA
jgi:hypothetical protein